MRFAIFFQFTFFALALVAAIGLWVPVMDVDAAQYAAMAERMSVSGEWLQLFDRGAPYLDKPPLLFWLSALSFKIFGVSDWAYKLPSFLISLGSCWGLFKLSQRYYPIAVAYGAVLMYMSCQGWMLMVNDVRTDLLLTSFVILAVWQGAVAWDTGKRSAILGLGIFVGFGMLSKGPLGLMIPVMALMGEVVRSRSFAWQRFLKLTWAIIPILLILFPMCLGLWIQYGSEGLYFFFWKQSFGRITGESDWRNGADSFFLTQNLLWAILPWTFVFIGALLFRVRNYFRQSEGWTSGAWILPLLVLSSSHYQLPHYIFVTLPFVSLYTAGWMFEKLAIKKQGWMIAVGVLCGIGVMGMLVAYGFIFPGRLDIGLVILFIICMIWGLSYVRFKQFQYFRLWLIPAWGWGIVNLYVGGFFYPSLLPYQASSNIGEWLRDQHKINAVGIYQEGVSHSLDFACRKTLPVWFTPKDLQVGKWVITRDKPLRELFRAGVKLKFKRCWKTYSVQLLSLPFLNPDTRNNFLDRLWIVEVEQVNSKQRILYQ